MSDIVLLQLPVWAVGCPPLGLGLLKSYLAKHGISSKIFDINAHLFSMRGSRYRDFWEVEHGYDYCNSHDTMLEYYQNNRAFFLYYLDRIHTLKPKIVGCSCFGASMELTKIFLEDLRNFYPYYKHLLGGPEVAAFMNNANELISRNLLMLYVWAKEKSALLGIFERLKRMMDARCQGLFIKGIELLLRQSLLFISRN